MSCEWEGRTLKVLVKNIDPVNLFKPPNILSLQRLVTKDIDVWDHPAKATNSSWWHWRVDDFQTNILMSKQERSKKSEVPIYLYSGNKQYDL